MSKSAGLLRQRDDAATLVTIHGPVGLDEPLLRAPVMLVVADADTDAHLHRLVIDHEGGLHGLADHGGDRKYSPEQY